MASFPRVWVPVTDSRALPACSSDTCLGSSRATHRYPGGRETLEVLGSSRCHYVRASWPFSGRTKGRGQPPALLEHGGIGSEGHEVEKRVDALGETLPDLLDDIGVALEDLADSKLVEILAVVVAGGSDPRVPLPLPPAGRRRCRRLRLPR